MTIDLAAQRAPERIYLQTHEVGWTWCKDRIDADPENPDTEYVRATAYLDLLAQLREAEKDRETWCGQYGMRQNYHIYKNNPPFMKPANGTGAAVDAARRAATPRPTEGNPNG